MDFKVAGTRDGHHRPADGHQDRRHHAARSWRKALEQARAGRLHILDKMAEALPEPRASISTLRAAHHHDQDPGGQDPRHHRARRQDDPLDRRAHRLQDRRRGRRARVDRLRRTRRPRARPIAIIEELTADRRDQQDLPGQGRARRGLRRLRRDPARHGRPAARLRDGRTTACRTCARGEGRRPDPRQGRQHRPVRARSGSRARRCSRRPRASRRGGRGGRRGRRRWPAPGRARGERRGGA